MKFLAALIPALLATGALARPSGLRNRVERRKNGALHSRPKAAVLDAEGKVEMGTSKNETQVSYSTNWAGAAYNEDSSTFKAVTASVVVPKPSSGGLGLLGSTLYSSFRNSTVTKGEWVGSVNMTPCHSIVPGIFE